MQADWSPSCMHIPQTKSSISSHAVRLTRWTPWGYASMEKVFVACELELFTIIFRCHIISQIVQTFFVLCVHPIVSRTYVIPSSIDCIHIVLFETVSSVFTVTLLLQLCSGVISASLFSIPRLSDISRLMNHLPCVRCFLEYVSVFQLRCSSHLYCTYLNTPHLAFLRCFLEYLPNNIFWKATRNSGLKTV